MTVQAQLLRRGGLKKEPKNAGPAVEAKINTLRGAALADATAKQADGKAKAKAKAKPEPKPGDRHAGAAVDLTSEVRPADRWKPPEELADVDFTQAEEELRQVVSGPSSDWLRDHHPGGEPGADVDESETPALVLTRLGRMTELAQLDTGLPPDCSEGLKAYVLSRLADEEEGTSTTQHDIQLATQEILSECVGSGYGEVAAEAAAILDSDPRSGELRGDEEVVINPIHVARSGRRARQRHHSHQRHPLGNHGLSRGGPPGRRARRATGNGRAPPGAKTVPEPQHRSGHPPPQRRRHANQGGSRLRSQGAPHRDAPPRRGSR